MSAVDGPRRQLSCQLKSGKQVSLAPNPAIISFAPGPADELSPFVTIHNPADLQAALVSQLTRYGLSSDRQSQLSGKLKGHKKDLLAMIQSYGSAIEIVAP